MSNQFPKSDVNRCLVQWARNMREGYVNLGASSINFSDLVEDDGDSYVYTPDYTLEEKLCLNEMMIIRVANPDMYQVANLEYIKQCVWLGESRVNHGWIDNNGRFHRITRGPKRSDFLRYVQHVYGVSKNQYYNRLNKLQRRIYERVVIA